MYSSNSAIEDIEALDELLHALKQARGIQRLSLRNIWPAQPVELSARFISLLAEIVRICFLLVKRSVFVYAHFCELRSSAAHGYVMCRLVINSKPLQMQWILLQKLYCTG